MYTTRQPAIVIMLIAVLAVCMSSAGFAATKYWDPADGIGNWNYGPYWNPDDVPVAGDYVRIEAGGSGWTLFCYYVNATNPLLQTIYVGNQNSTGTAEARIIQSQDNLHAWRENVGYYGTGKHFQSGGTVTLDDALYMGVQNDNSYGYYQLDAGSLNTQYSRVGFHGDGEFLQTGGTHTCTVDLGLGLGLGGEPYGQGTYTLQNGTIDAGSVYVGARGPGDFFQSGGTVNATVNGLTLGHDRYGRGHYELSNGDLNTYRTRLRWLDSTFVHTGGTHDVTSTMEVGYSSDTSNEVSYTLSNTGALTVGTNMFIGYSTSPTLGRFHQTGGNAIVGNTLVLAEPTGTMVLEGGSCSSAYVSNDGHYQQSGGTLTTGAWTNTYDFQQSGGILNATQYTNQSPVDVIIQGTADCRVNTFNNDSGKVWLKNGTLRGKYAGGGNYFMCDFTNDADFEMDAGQFIGHFTNNGTFRYDGGTFSQSTFTNYGGYSAVNLLANFTCRRIVNHGSLTLLWDRQVTADGAGYANAVENNGSLNMYPRTVINVGGSTLVNKGQMYAGAAGTDAASIIGNLENQNYLLPCISGIASGRLNVSSGNFTQTAAAELRIRLNGSAYDDYDHLIISGSATLAGKLNVLLTGGFVPSLGNSFSVVKYSSRSGQFNPVVLPALTGDLQWEVDYGSVALTLTVVQPQSCPGDTNGDCCVNLIDFSTLANQWQQTGCTSPDYCDGADLNGDGTVNGADLNILDDHWRDGCPPI